MMTPVPTAKKRKLQLRRLIGGFADSVCDHQTEKNNDYIDSCYCGDWYRVKGKTQVIARSSLSPIRASNISPSFRIKHT